MNGTDPNIYALSLVKGWNLISLARIPDSNSPSEIFGDKMKGKVWHWEDSQFKVASEVLSLKGYWVYAPANAVVDISLDGNDPL